MNILSGPFYYGDPSSKALSSRNQNFVDSFEIGNFKKKVIIIIIVESVTK